MNPAFRRLMDEAARLVRGGQLGEATAAIQEALGGVAPAPASAHASARLSEDDVIDVEARVVGTPTPAPEASQGPTAESFGTGHFRNEFGARGYKLFEPARDGRPLPLVVMLHGCTQDPDDFARGTRMNALARAHGALVLYPAQSQRANAQRCWNWFKHNHQARDKGEPAILAGLVRDVAARHGVDPDRVYVAGLSAGGAMAAILGEAYPDLFAAVGVHSGLPAGSADDVQSAFAVMAGGSPAARRGSRHGTPPPTIVFQGDADATVNVLNGERVMAATGLSARPDAQRGASAQGVPYTRRAWVDGQGAERGELWTLHGMGHAWSGGDATGSYTAPRGPDASQEMLRFFLRHPLRR